MKAFRYGFFGCLGVGAAVVVVAILIAIAGGLGKTSTSNNPSPGASSSASTASPTPNPKFASFGDGTHAVGSEIMPGTYRTRSASAGCYFARLKGFGGTLEEVIANENTDDPAVVTIAATDKGFESTRCSTWTQDLSAITTSPTSFADGDYIVGTDITAGTYRSNGQSGCYYARLRGFSHTLEDVISNANTDAAAIVTIAASDKGFEATRCGSWTKVG